VHAATDEEESAAEAAAEATGISLEPFECQIHERTVETATNILGEEGFAAARAAGRQLAPQDVAAYVLGQSQSQMSADPAPAGRSAEDRPGGRVLL
jgi:hypothetical protein